jgi:hypothetical protein
LILNQLLISKNILSICVLKFPRFGLVTIMLVSSAYKQIFDPIVASLGKSFMYICLTKISSLAILEMLISVTVFRHMDRHAKLANRDLKKEFSPLE